MSLNFTKTTVPASPRATAPNPFADVLPLPKGEAVAVELPAGTKDKEVDALVRKAQARGREANTTTRHKREGNEKSGWKLIFWSTDMMTRDSGSSSSVPENPTPEDVEGAALATNTDDAAATPEPAESAPEPEEAPKTRGRK